MTRNRSRDEVLAEFVETKPFVQTVEEAADRMGMSFAALDKALERARAAGDRRGDYKPLGIRRPKPRSESESDRILQGWMSLADRGLTYPQAAMILDCSVTSLRTVVSRARLAGVEVPVSSYWSRGRKPKPAPKQRPVKDPTSVKAPRGKKVERQPVPEPEKYDEDEILDEWEFLREGGEHHTRAAERIGIARTTFDRILLDARRRGDDRGALTNDAAYDIRRTA